MRWWWFVVVCVVGVACSSGSASLHPAGAPSPSPAMASPSASAGSPAPLPSPSTAVFAPSPDAPIPADPNELAAALVTDTQALATTIDAWTTSGNPATGSPPEAVVLEALYQQRIYRTLIGDPALRAPTYQALPAGLRTIARATVDAGSGLSSIVRPVPTAATFTTGPAKPAGLLLRWFHDAEARFGVDWEDLAAVMFVESKFGRVRASSTAGAQGPMQFIPSTWAAYGLGGDIHDPHDAIMGAANYLHASGARARERSALYSYNHSWAYVDAVQTYADQMRTDPRAFFAYYNWQVFVLTATGVQRLTGPGL